MAGLKWKIRSKFLFSVGAKCYVSKTEGRKSSKNASLFTHVLFLTDEPSIYKRK